MCKVVPQHRQDDLCGVREGWGREGLWRGREGRMWRGMEKVGGREDDKEKEKPWKKPMQCLFETYNLPCKVW